MTGHKNFQTSLKNESRVTPKHYYLQSSVCDHNEKILKIKNDGGKFYPRPFNGRWPAVYAYFPILDHISSA